MLIAAIFIIKAFQKLWHIRDDYPPDAHFQPSALLNYTCHCVPATTTNSSTSSSSSNITDASAVLLQLASYSQQLHTWHWKKAVSACQSDGGMWLPTGCQDNIRRPDIFFFSVIVFIATFVIAFALKQLRNSSFFPTRVRSIISDFAVVLAILLMTLIASLSAFHLPTLQIPSKFQPTAGFEQRGWIVPFRHARNPWWTFLVAIGPASLAVILIFMDQQITAVIVNRKENRLAKGPGYHLDLLVRYEICLLF